MLKNLLQVSLKEFRDATKVFKNRRVRLGPVSLTYESECLSIESGGVTAVMNAAGEWHGMATISPDILRALVRVPPLHDPMTISYADGNLLVGNITIICQWNTASQAIIHDLANPSIIDLLAMGKLIPHLEIRGSGLGKKIRLAHEKAERRIMSAAK